MKKYSNKIIVLFAISCMFFTGCDSYERTGVESEIYVNHEALNMFIGEQVQLTASPIGDSFEWKSVDTDIATVSNGLVNAVNEGNTIVVASKGDASFNVDITVSKKVPLTDINLNKTNLELTPGSSETISVEIVPTNANDVSISDFAWWSDDESIARVDISGDVTGIKEGVTNIYYRRGNITKSVTVNVSLTFPFKGPHIISASEVLILPFRDFDKGGEGVAFHENDNGNSFGNDNYRKEGGDSNSTSVDVENGNNVGWTADGEWLLYTVEVVDEGTYDVQISSSGGGDGSFHIEVDEVDVTGQISLPSNGSWSNWEWHPSDAPMKISFTKGYHKIKFYIDKAGFNMLNMKFEYVNN